MLDADRVAHGLYEAGTAMCADIVEEFGAGVRSPDGSIDRRALGAVVFADPARLKALEAIVHPALRRHLMERVEALSERGEDVVLEMALLSRWPEMAAKLDRVLGVSAPRELRLARLRARNGISEDEALQRLDRQESEEVLLACATETMVNVGTVDAFFADLEGRFAQR